MTSLSTELGRTFPQREAAITHLHNLLAESTSPVQVRVSLWGARLVSVHGCQGSTTIDNLARSFFEKFKSCEQPSASLQTRVQADEIWDRIKSLYEESDRSINSNVFLKVIVFFRETISLLFSGCTQIKIRNPDLFKGSFLYTFSEPEFNQLFPGARRSGISFRGGVEWIIGSKELASEALKKASNS